MIQLDDDAKSFIERLIAHGRG